jgi:hypothetical protein
MIDMVAVHGLRELWAGTTGGAPLVPDLPIRPLLDTLGLGLEQVMTHLGRERPGWDDFVTWAEELVGTPDADAVARYHAWAEGKVPPAAEQARQAAVMALPPIFSAIEMAGWARDGVIVLRCAIAPSEAAAIAAHLWTLKDANPDDPATWYARGANGIMVQHFQHPAMDVPRRATRIHRAFAQLYGHADLIASCDRLSFNPPICGDYDFPGPHLHWDTSLADPIAFEAQGILYLTDTAAHQGALVVVPGFHHRLATGWLSAIGDCDPRSVDLSAEAVPVPAGAGDLVIWRQELPHGASPNTAARPRLAQYVTLYPMHRPDQRPWL